MPKNRKIINYRKVGDIVKPINMSAKEYIHFLSHTFGIRTSTGWNGIEKRLHRANYEEDTSYNIQTRDEALEFLGIIKTPAAPDGLEKRKKEERRIKQQDIRKDKIDRRLTKQRRQEEQKKEFNAGIIHLVTVVIGLTMYAFLWSIAK